MQSMNSRCGLYSAKCVMHILGFTGDEDVEEEETELWLNTIDMGGLWHVYDSTFTFCCCCRSYQDSVW